jgi:hypothetical protein
MTKKAKKPIEGELTLKALRSVVGGRELSAHARHGMQHHHPPYGSGLLNGSIIF